jgi:Uma2 family endonuclease
VLSPSTTHVDIGPKMRTYQRCQVPHYWTVDPVAATLSVYRWHQDGYLLVLSATRGEKARAEPFDAIELDVGALFPPAS